MVQGMLVMYLLTILWIVIYLSTTWDDNYNLIGLMMSYILLWWFFIFFVHIGLTW